MTVEETIDLSKRISQLLEDGKKSELRAFLNDLYPQDLADALKNIKETEKLNCFLLLDLEHAGDLLAELNHDTQKSFLKTLGSKRLAPIVSQMDVDDATDFISQLRDEDQTEILEILPDPIQQAHVQELIDYPDESAGRIMSTDFLRLRSDMTIQIALNYVRRKAAEEDSPVYYLYVVDNTNKLVGIISLKDLICAPLNDIIANHMNSEVITCKVLDDQETVANIISKYDMIAIPITDEVNTLKGVVTVDDVVDVFSEETTEDIYQGSGISDASHSDELISGNINYSVKARLPWLLITLVGETIAAFIIAFYDESIILAPIAISFMPLLSGLSGNVGGQTATIMVRGLVTGDIEIKNTAKHIFHELKIGIILGLACAIITGLVAWYHYNLPFLGLIVAFALTVSMTTGVLLGTVFPIVLQYLKKDPAAACSPVITTLLDIFTFSFYLAIVSFYISNLR